MKIFIFGLLFFSAAAHGQIISRKVDYMDQDVQLQGVLYWDKAVKEKRPGILVFPEWWGLNNYARRRARMLAGLGYVVFAADMYGKGIVTKRAKRAKALMKKVTANPALWIQRANAALDQLKGAPKVDVGRIAAIGYSFGGGTTLQMAYSGFDLKGIVSFHGSLPAAPEESKGLIKANILILHGEDDSFLPEEVVINFKSKLNAARANWKMVSYEGVRHGFTNKDAGKYGMENLKYDAAADQDSWKRMRKFLTTVFAAAKPAPASAQ